MENEKKSQMSLKALSCHGKLLATRSISLFQTLAKEFFSKEELTEKTKVFESVVLLVLDREHEGVVSYSCRLFSLSPLLSDRQRSSR